MGITSQTRWFISPDAATDARAFYSVDARFTDEANMYDDNDGTEGGGLVDGDTATAARGAMFTLDGGHPDLPSGFKTLWAGVCINWEGEGTTSDAQFEVQVEDVAVTKWKNNGVNGIAPINSRNTYYVMFAPADRFQTSAGIRCTVVWRGKTGGAAVDLKVYNVWFVAIPGRKTTKVGG